MTNDAPAAGAQTTEVARAEASNVAQTAGNQAREVVNEATHQVRSVVGQVQSALRTRANDQASKLASTLHDASRQMQSMAERAPDQQPSFAASLVREGANAAERFASRLDQGGVDSVVGDVRGWARRNPGGFLLGAGVVGFMAGRVARNLSAASRGGEGPAPAAVQGEGDGWRMSPPGAAYTGMRDGGATS